MRFRRFLLVGLAMTVLLAPPRAVAQSIPSNPLPNDSFFTPRPHQFDLEIANNFMIDDPSSVVRRREDSVNGSALHLKGDLGVDTFQMPTLRLDFWFDELNAI